jgi:acyl carrier protein|tara:strand:- start:3713 stop:3958 length:246 start_codon:yes stop_codon:yes gene_type:complete
MNIKDITRMTNEVLVEEFEIDESIISDDANFRSTLDLDSLDYVDLVVFVEENFKVKLTADDFLEVVTFNDFYSLILNKINE